MSPSIDFEEKEDMTIEALDERQRHLSGPLYSHSRDELFRPSMILNRGVIFFE
jgi:hypothetical protein